MNIAVLLSGGKGTRFGAKIPKQYLDLCGKPVIDYVIDAVKESKTIDELVIVIDKDCIDYIEDKNNPHIHYVSNGKERLNSVMNGLEFIKQNYKDCEKIIIVQATSPFITGKIIDDYIKNLDEYDVVTTAKKCPGEIFNINNYKRRERDEYYFCESPEAFKFRELYDCIDVNSKYSELIYHYKKKPNIKFYTDFKDNVKLTFENDLKYAEFLMKLKK